MAKIVTLGEIMLRLATEVGTRLSETHSFQAIYGGGEANVAISLANFGHETFFVSKVPDNALGEGVKKHLNCYQVNTDYLLFGGERLASYYMEAGVGERAANVVYDRKYSSFSEMKTVEWSLTPLFEQANILHLSGITPALSSTWETLILEIVSLAKKNQMKISFDVNYRGKLWNQEVAGNFLKKILPVVDYCSMGTLDAIYLLKIPAYQGNEEELIYYYQEIRKRYPNIQVLYSTKRKVLSASENHLIGTLWINDHYYESTLHEMLPIVDRVGGGDAFSAGILHGIISNYDPNRLVEFATTASALKHTIHGDCNQFTVTEVEAIMAAGSGKIIR
nr:sugar kinase [Melissococcus plutonius]